MEHQININENDIVAEDIFELNQLLKQMNPEAPIVDFEVAKEVMQKSIIVTLRDPAKENKLIGMGTLIPILKLFTLCGAIEDVVVDESYRGDGLGKRIIEILKNKGKALGMKFVFLTSNPKREGANRLYQSMGFKIPETNLYRFYY